ncbi:MAG: DUF2723 domain-containing protein [Candidatus Coatesbacteria bacterium]
MRRLALAALFLASFGLYLRSMHPAFQLDDSPWTIAACVNLGTQHAPGYPVLTLLGRLAASLPVGSVYFRVNLLAAVLGAGGVVLAAGIASALFPTGAGLAAAVAAGACLAVSRIWWECALSAKGGLYLLNWLLVAGAAAFLIWKGARRGAALAALALGLGAAAHWMTVIWWFPALAAAGRPWDRRRLAVAVVIGALGAGIYLQLPLCAGREPAWGDPVTARDLADTILRRSFLAQAGMRKASLTWLQAGHGLLTPVREGGLAFAFLAFAGCAALWHDRRRALALLLAGPLLTLASVSVLANPVHLSTGQLYLWLSDRFHLPYLGVLAVAAAAGILLLRRAAPTRWVPGVWGLAVLLPLAGGLGRFGTLDHSSDYLGHDYAANLVSGARTPAVLLAEADYQSFPLWGPLAIDGTADGITFVITNPFLDRPAGWRRLARRLPAARGLEEAGGPLRGLPDAASSVRIVALADRLRAAGPVYHLSMCSFGDLRRRLAFRSLLFEVGPPGTTGRPPDAPAVARVFARLRLRGLHGESPPRDEAAWSVLDGYGQLLAMPGHTLFLAGKLEASLAALRAALRLPGRVNRAAELNVIGQACGRLNRYAEAENAFREATRIEPHNLDFWTNVATACAAQGNTEEAMRLFGWVLERNPRHAAARANLAALRARLAGPPPRRSGVPSGIPLP